MVDSQFWKGKSVVVTGHTGFKGSWLTNWLMMMGAEVHGYALPPESQSLFNELDLQSNIRQVLSDIRQREELQTFIQQANPDVVLHLAAQPLVLDSYKRPLYTWETNLVGTMNVLHAMQCLTKRTAAVIITTDKVYLNLERELPYEETDALGGHDPYSASKAATEILVSSWRSSFCSENSNLKIASARAGNVIGGGDWAENRIVPDMIRALSKNETVTIRNPYAVRPWQHVLESLYGYLLLAECLYNDEGTKYQTAYNFGPDAQSNKSVLDLAKEVLKTWPGNWVVENEFQQFHEAKLLTLNASKAKKHLHWKPKWSFEETIRETVNWYQLRAKGNSVKKITAAQIEKYMTA